MSEPAMTRFPVPAIDDLPDDIQERLEAEKEQAGFLPNVFKAFAYKPAQFRAFFDYYDGIVEHSTLTREEIEFVIVATSGANDCLYCVVAHGALLRIYADDPQLADQVATNPRTATIPEMHKELCLFAIKLTEKPATVDETDLETLRGHGYTAEEIWDIASLTSLFNLSNRMAHVADMRPNEEFYTLGR